jgi:hypothetical protein
MTEETRKLAEEMAAEAYRQAKHRLAVAQMECEEAFCTFARLSRDVMPKEMEETK